MGKKRRYSDEERAAALAALKANRGNLTLTARQVGVPLTTLRQWSTGDRHPEATQMSIEKSRDMAQALQDLAWKLIDALPDKIEGATLNQTATALGISIDKARLLRDEPTQITKTDVTRRIADRAKEELDAYFERAAAREEAGAVPGNGGGKPLDT